MDGICTLANDAIYDQLVALLNSIEAHEPNRPVCVFPYNDQTERIQAEIDRRPQVQLYRDQASIDHWDRFYCQVWDNHPSAQDQWQRLGSSRYHRFGIHRRFCAFDGPFDRFLYIDGDALLLNRVEPIFAALDHADWVVYDFQHKDPSHVYNLESPQLRQIFGPDRLAQEIFCSGLYATHRNRFSPEQQQQLLAHLAAGESEMLYIMAGDQTLLNYMAMRSGLRIQNLALTLPKEQVTGCCVTSPHFQPHPLQPNTLPSPDPGAENPGPSSSPTPNPTAPDPILYDKNTRLLYLHYIGLSSKLFTRLCQGENLDFPYREIFLHYRYRHAPDQRPPLTGKPQLIHRPPNLFKRALRKLGLSR